MPDYKVGVLTLSDSRKGDLQNDLSGQKAKAILEREGYKVLRHEVIADDLEDIIEKLNLWSKDLDLIITSGGTGLSKRDNTPEATKAVIDKEVPGISEALRSYSVSINLKGMLSRGVSGIKGETLIINLPGSPKAVDECLNYILPVLDHALGILKGSIQDCARR